MTADRRVNMQRKTSETDINLTLDLDGKGQIQVETGIGFFDHMLEQLAFWAGWDLKLACQGDLQVDTHHTVEDVALTLGEAYLQARKNQGEIERFASVYIPMDETLSRVVVDLSGRPFTVFNVSFPVERVGSFETAMAGHFFRSFAVEARVTLHIACLYGENAHHMIESIFKGLGLAVRQALTPRPGQVASTKGTL